MDIRGHRAFNARVRVAEVTKTHADLTDADTSQTLDLFDVPAGAQLLGVPDVALGTPFSGGGNNALALDIGTAGDDDAIVNAADLYAAAVDGKASSVPAGIAPTKRFAAATTIKGKFDSVGGTMAGFTAGSVTIRQLYCVPDNT